MNEKYEFDKELVRQIEADPSKFFEIRDVSGGKLNNSNERSHFKQEKSVVKENNQNSLKKENSENDNKSKKESKHKK